MYKICSRFIQRSSFNTGQLEAWRTRMIMRRIAKETRKVVATLGPHVLGESKNGIASAQWIVIVVVFQGRSWLWLQRSSLRSRLRAHLLGRDGGLLFLWWRKVSAQNPVVVHHESSVSINNRKSRIVVVGGGWLLFCDYTSRVWR